VADADKGEVPNDENGNPDTSNGGKNYVDVRRTDLWRAIRGRGRSYMETYMHFIWENEGKDHPDSRETEDLEITIPKGTSTDAGADGSDGGDGGSTGGPVTIKIIKSMVMTSATNSQVNPNARWPYFSAFIGKRVFFENSTHDGRKVKIKKVGGSGSGGS